MHYSFKLMMYIILGTWVCTTAGTELENIIFKIVNSDGVVDETIHDKEKYGQSHTCTIKSELFNTRNPFGTLL